MSHPVNHVEETRERFAQMPVEKRSGKIRRTFWGVAIVLFGWTGNLRFPDVPDLVWFGTVFFGAVMISGELFMHPFKLFVAMVRDLFAAVRGKGDG